MSTVSSWLSSHNVVADPSQDTVTVYKFLPVFLTYDHTRVIESGQQLRMQIV